MYILTVDCARCYRDYSELAEYLTAARRAQLESRRSDISAQCSFFAELLVRRHLICELGFDNRDIEIIRSPLGKPRVKGCDEIHFSVAHKNDTVCVEFSSSPIGIDIEDISELKQRVADRTFTENEKDALSKSDAKAELFSTIWTRKEAYSKMLGTGYSCGFESINTLGGEFDEICETVRRGDYIISVVGTNKPPLVFEEIEIRELAKQLGARAGR